MNQVNEKINSNLFLHTHEALKEFLSLFTNAHNDSSWTIVCERSSDISAIRSFVFTELQEKYEAPLTIIGGLSFISLDQLGQNICALLASAKNVDFKFTIPQSLFKPYLTIKQQEQVTQFILSLFHLSAQDTRPIAQQLLTLLDTPLPKDITLVDALMSALNLKKKRSYKDISAVLLKQILASFQATRIVLSRYSRLQTLVNDFLDHEFWQLTTEYPEYTNKILPEKLLHGSVFWMSAPEYSRSEKPETPFKPGEYSQNLVNDFLTFVLKARKKFEKNKSSLFVYNRTILQTECKTKSEHSENSRLNAIITQNQRDFYKVVTDEIQAESSPEKIKFLGEFDPQTYQAILQNAGGTYQVLDSEILAWKNREQENFFVDAISTQIDKKYEHFLETASYIENFSKLEEIAKVYSIPVRDLSDQKIMEMFEAYLKNESFSYCKNEHFNTLQKPYSFFATRSVPEEITSFWSQTRFESTSLATRLLNQIFTFFQTQGISIENPCHDLEFLYFWKHIGTLEEQFPKTRIQFILENQEIIESFPIQFTKTQIEQLSLFDKNMNAVSNQIFESKLLNSNISSLKKLFEQYEYSTVSTTQFEKYVECPFAFFLEHGLSIRPKQIDKNFTANPLDIGTRVHSVCEKLISEMVIKYGNDEYLIAAGEIYQNVLNAITPENIFLSHAQLSWDNAISFLSEDIRSIFTDIFKLIFFQSQFDTNPESALNKVLSEEILKRAFLKFLNTEIELIAAGKKKRVGTAREFPFSTQIGELTVRGCIDRVDQNTDGYEIIDYKVSPISKSVQKLCLLPSEFLALKNNKKLSIQGAVYALAFGKAVFDLNNNEFAGNDNRLSGFSLYRLKNIKDDSALLTYSFPENENESGAAQIQHIENELKPYTERLLNKDYFPRPLNNKQTCQYCPYQDLCPYPTQQGFLL